MMEQVTGYRLQDSLRSRGTGYSAAWRFQKGLQVITLLLLPVLLTAQPKQKIPPFLQYQPTPKTVEMEGKTYVLPDFSIAPAYAGATGLEIITNTPLGFLATRQTKSGLRIDLRRYRDVFRVAEFYRTAPNPLTVTEGLGRTPDGPVFDFTRSAPHLAFFCRLEINEDKGFIIPAKFRLGGHTHWQDQLSKRD